MTQSKIAVGKQEGMYWFSASQTWTWGEEALFVNLSVKWRLEFLFVTSRFYHIEMEFQKNLLYSAV